MDFSQSVGQKFSFSGSDSTEHGRLGQRVFQVDIIVCVTVDTKKPELDSWFKHFRLQWHQSANDENRQKSIVEIFDALDFTL